ncbi:MAG TPA: ATP-binding protein, partial [Cyclobacteriaceae bacterium]
MFEQYQICPYTGLRSFTEEESLYFKGREEHIDQATEQLQRNKFLMLTGASGDGKSSLVYAGIVPNARAGFLKSRYTQWKVADFRPERTPFKNLCSALAKQLDIANPGTAEAELEHGFSALVDLYKNSKCYVDVDSVEWQVADESQKAALKRSAANLIIIVDQFEEFFTNPENYHNGVPSVASNLVLNVLLETARIALEENLPIYIVFTMRSDYIGQCAAFRSLPEYIGFSQFFVPRLNRSQLQQVIEEPAVLSGNKISRRLSERLIHDIAEGVDQLPILQHALNQIWHAADSGKEEMDLIHYAMVGGIGSADLPDEEVNRFTEWFAKLPEKIKHCYREPNLQNVLDAHANKLFESAAETYRIRTGKVIADEMAKEIIKKAFICLTKIDQSRAVRNRMTLKEICCIINREDIDSKTVGSVLNIFREPGNTFIRPFITDVKESEKLSEDAILDITHESLIRNWRFLEEWAEEEFENYTISLDFEQQLHRWVDSGKSNGFLLSIGPLTYFENWYNQVKPNPWWIARYLPEDIDQGKKLEKAEKVLANTNQFINQSAKKHRITRVVMRYGPRRIAAALAIIALVTLSSFAIRNYYKQQNAVVMKTIKEQGLTLAGSKKIGFLAKSSFLAEQVRSGVTTIDEVIGNINDPLVRLNTINGLTGFLLQQGRTNPAIEINKGLMIADSLAAISLTNFDGFSEIKEPLKEINFLRTVLEFGYFHNPSERILKMKVDNAKRSAGIVNFILSKEPKSFIEINSLNVALENAINYKAFTNEEITSLLSILSPFENANRSEWVTSKYARDNLMGRGFSDYAFKFNGLYQELAYLYAAQGKSQKVLQCVDSLLKYNQNYYQNDYAAMIDNGSNIAAVFFIYDQFAALNDFVKGYCIRKRMPESEFYHRIIGWSSITTYGTGNLGGATETNLNVSFSDPRLIEFVFSKFRESIIDIYKTDNERNFNLALAWKEEGIIKQFRADLSSQPSTSESIDKLFDKAIDSYSKVAPSYLNELIMTANLTETDGASRPRKFLFLYPDFRTAFTPTEPRQFHFFYVSDAFIKYLVDQNLIDRLYSDQDLDYFQQWIELYFFVDGFLPLQVRKKADSTTLRGLERNLDTRKVPRSNLNRLFLLLGNEAFNSGDTKTAERYFSKLETDKLVNIMNYPQFGANRLSFNEIADAATALIDIGQSEKGYAIIKQFKNPINRSSIYAYA